ncbi:hypothetical protein OOT00_15120 [Desulfobotulus sp. H1]|uniref:Uncharacterized protein n=1 Tax=Desulfobotulus pelophilus TaxID=2823377 RepID=A0ABT3NCZ0_9BACT|nr:hypothetical protein [Desulfobotulus pelophilus]MCW7755313.1 hypothetical protein [Desulfobotulus pelophilus]
MKFNSLFCRSTQSRQPSDRRSPQDRRESHDLTYFIHDNPERRMGGERRQSEERRKQWVRISDWYSVNCEEVGSAKK